MWIQLTATSTPAQNSLMPTVEQPNGTLLHLPNLLQPWNRRQCQQQQQQQQQTGHLICPLLSLYVLRKNLDWAELQQLKHV